MAKKTSPWFNSFDHWFNRDRTLDEIKQTVLSQYENVTEKEIEDRYRKNISQKLAKEALAQTLGDALSMIDRQFYGEHQNLACVTNRERTNIYEFNGTHYEIVSDVRLYRLVDEYLYKRSLNEMRTRSTVKDICARLPAVITRRFDHDNADPSNLLNMKNGVFNKNTRTLTPHTPEIFFTHVLSVPYEPEATCPSFESFIDRVTGNNNETKRMIEEMFAYCVFYNGNPFHKVFILYGKLARNGKSTTVGILTELMGESNVSSLSIQQISEIDKGHDSSLLVNKRLNVSEESTTEYIDSPAFTNVISEGTITINPKYQPAYRHKLKTKFVITCNDLPKMKSEQGFSVRAVIIPFDVVIPEDQRIANYDRVLVETEGAGIFNWCLRAFEKLTTQGKLFISEESKRLAKEYHKSNNSVHAYLEECCDFDEFSNVPISELYGKGSWGASNNGYFNYCMDRSIKPVGMNKFSDELERYFGLNKEHKTGFEVDKKTRHKNVIGIKEI